MSKFFYLKGNLKVSGVDGLGDAFDRNIVIEVPLPTTKAIEAKELAKEIVENFSENRRNYIRIYCDQISKQDEIIEKDFYLCSEEEVK